MSRGSHTTARAAVVGAGRERKPQPEAIELKPIVVVARFSLSSTGSGIARISADVQRSARTHSHQRWRCAPRAGQSWRPCVLGSKSVVIAPTLSGSMNRPLGCVIEQNMVAKSDVSVAHKPETSTLALNRSSSAEGAARATTSRSALKRVCRYHKLQRPRPKHRSARVAERRQLPPPSPPTKRISWKEIAAKRKERRRAV